jgi:hypothetical protein
MTKNLVPILAIFLVAVVTFAALQIINIVTKDSLPQTDQKQVLELNPKLNTTLIDSLKKLPAD